jgi:hypothetical protein
MCQRRLKLTLGVGRKLTHLAGPWGGQSVLSVGTPAVTEIVRMPDRGHALTIDDGWREAQTALEFVKRFT